MATIEKYTTKTGETRYMVRYRKPDHRQTKKRGFATKRDAEAYAATVEVQKLRVLRVADALGRIRVSQLADEWLDRKQIDFETVVAKSIATAWHAREAVLGRKRLTDIDVGAVEAWIAEMRREVVDVDQDGNRVVTKKAAGATVVLRAYGVLAGLLDAAVKARRLSSNPARHRRTCHASKPSDASASTIPRSRRSRPPRSIRRSSGSSHTPVFGGVKRSRCASSTWTSYASASRSPENAVQVEQVHHVGTPKSGEARVSAIPEFLVFGCALIDGRPPGALVFAGDNGGYLLRPKSERGWFDRAVIRSGVPTVTLHDLRHTAASLAISAGVNVKALQRDARARVGGHDSRRVFGPVRR